MVLVDRDYRRTWREFSDEVDRIARGLMALGVEKGGKVAIWATNVPHWVALMFATAKIGAVLVTVNTGYKISEIEYLLSQSEYGKSGHHQRIPRYGLCEYHLRAGAGAARAAARQSALGTFPPSSSACSSSARKNIAACIP